MRTKRKQAGLRPGTQHAGRWGKAVGAALFCALSVVSVAGCSTLAQQPEGAFTYSGPAPLYPSQVQVADGYRPCTTEDDPGPCFWNAEEQGNGEGRSFWVEADGTVSYEDEEVSSLLLSSRLTRIPNRMVSVAMEETGLPRRLAKQCRWVDLRGTTYVLCPRGRWFSS